MKNTEKGLTRRALLGNSLRTAAGIMLPWGASSLVSSCAIDENENKHYRFDLSRLEDWQAGLFLKAGEDYWGIYDGRDDSSRNKVYFGNVSEGEIAHANWDWRYSDCNLDPRGLLEREIECEKIYTFTITFRDDLNWVNCDIEGESGNDFYRVAAHELGHIALERGNELHSDTRYPIMQASGKC